MLHFDMNNEKKLQFCYRFLLTTRNNIYFIYKCYILNV